MKSLYCILKNGAKKQYETCQPLFVGNAKEYENNTPPPMNRPDESGLLLEGNQINPLLLSGAKSRFFSGRGVDIPDSFHREDGVCNMWYIFR